MTNNLTILVVDDTREVREVIEAVLQAAGYKVLTLEDGRGVAKLLDRQHIDLVLTDLLMPEMDGFALIKEIRPKWPSLPIIAMSGWGDFGDHDHGLLRAKVLGASAVLDKRITRETLYAAIDEAIAVAASRAQAPQAV
jgi:CheY-like chemotaxis protein